MPIDFKYRDWIEYKGRLGCCIAVVIGFNKFEVQLMDTDGYEFTITKEESKTDIIKVLNPPRFKGLAKLNQ